MRKAHQFLAKQALQVQTCHQIGHEGCREGYAIFGSSPEELNGSRKIAGRTPRVSPKATPGGTPAAAQLRQNRRNTARQAQTKKRQALISATRLFAGADGVPRVVAVVPLSPDVSAAATATIVADAVGAEEVGCPEVEGGIWKIRCVHPDRHTTLALANHNDEKGQTASKPPFSLLRCPTAGFTQRSMRAKPPTTSSSYCLQLWRLITGATPSCVRCRRRACHRLLRAAHLQMLRRRKRLAF